MNAGYAEHASRLTKIAEISCVSEFSSLFIRDRSNSTYHLDIESKTKEKDYMQTVALLVLMLISCILAILLNRKIKLNKIPHALLWLLIVVQIACAVLLYLSNH